ncbi:MAG: hypothetical protein GX683_06405, partial [Ruminococcaceae bacterium]|nr:hypothetical protein [Oscillospiraceae bacterium]
MTEKILALLKEKKKVALKEFLAEQNPADIASWIEELLEDDEIAKEE